MYWKMKKLSAGLSVELTISIVLVTVALFVTLGIFSDNLKEMVSSGSLQKFFLGGDKTKYSAFNRDYSNASVETLMTGEQGLEQIRKLANNASDELIDKNIGAPDKLTAQDANAILYYSLIVKAIVGEPHMCIPMKKNSEKKCIVPEIAGYKYAIDLNSLTATGVELNSPITVSKPLKLLYLKNYATSLASLGSTITLNGNGESTLNSKEKYDFITDLTEAAKPYVAPSVLIVNTNNSFGSHDKSIKSTMEDLRYTLSNKIKIANASCQNSATNVVVSERCCAKESSPNGQCYVGRFEMQDFIAKMNTFSDTLNSRGENDKSIIPDFIYMLNSPYNGNTKSSSTYLEIINNDHYNSPTSCEYLISTLSDIKSKTKANFVIPQCVPSTNQDTGGSSDVDNVIENAWDDFVDIVTGENDNKDVIKPKHKPNSYDEY